MKIGGLAIALCFLPGLLWSQQPVSVRPFSEIAIFLDRQAAATVESLDRAELSAEVSARVRVVHALPGQRVGADELLVTLEDAEYRIGVDSARARLEIAEARLDLARIRAERARRLKSDDYVSDDELLQAETDLRLAEAEVGAAVADKEQAELLLTRTQVHAPFEGVVTKRRVSPGALAAPGTPLMALVAIGGLEVTAMVPPDQVAGLKQADAVAFESDGQDWPVRLARLAPVIDADSRAQEARLVFVGQAPPSGAEGRIRWTDPRPALAGNFVVQRNGELGVLILDAGRSEAAFLPLPGADAGRPYRADELALDTLIIDEGRRRVQPGDRIEASVPY